jgi:predicted membrane-bound spermidine synthase
MEVPPTQSKSNARTFDVTTCNLRIFFVFFVISGFCGLLYEVVWGRLAMASFGVTTALASIVISMFMAGLGLGSWGAGVLARRVLAADGRRALRTYAIAELMIGISSLAVPFELKTGRLLLLHIGRFGAWQSSGYYILVGLWIAITLVPWCTCMGATFPLLMAAIRQAASSASEHSFSFLYVGNVLGGLVGTLVSAFVLIELLGFQGTLYVAGGMNAILALSAFAISFFVVLSPSVDKPIPRPAVRPALYGLPRNALLLFLFTSGLVSMGLEVVWIRQFTPYLGNVVYAFASLLAVYLLATVVGSRDYRSKANSRQPEESVPAWSLLALSALLPLLATDPLLPLTAGLRLSAIVFFCALTGFLTPMLVDSWSSGDPDRAGTAYAVNIAGSITGPLLASFLLLPWLSERWTTLVLSIPLFAIAALIAFRAPSKTAQPKSGFNPRLKFAIATVAAILLFALSHDFESVFASREVKRDYAATVIATGQGFDRQLLVNGVGMTMLTPITKFMVHMPLASMSRRPQNGLVICFGMGTSFRSMLSWGIPTTTVDLIPSVPELFSYYHPDAPKLVSSPLAQIVIDDGRRFLDGSNQTYDVVVVDPPPPVEASGSSLLYSREFYEVVKKHLRKDGILQMWYPDTIGDTATSVSIAKALLDSFPYVRAFRSYDSVGIHFMASMEPIPAVSSSVLASRMPSAAVSDLVEWGPLTTPQQQFDLVLAHEFSLQKFIAREPRVPALQDDRPINEYFLLRHRLHFYN